MLPGPSRLSGWLEGSMRIGIIAMLVVGLWAGPALAQQKPHRRECVKLTQQIARYERDAGWARERGNDLWEQANLSQVDNLSTRRAHLCPEYRPPDYSAEFLAFVDVAARVATRWFLSGL